jgi:hypothetical protein
MTCTREGCQRDAAEPRGVFAAAIFAARGYCSRDCWTLATTQHLQLCANESCKRGEGGGRRLFAPRQKNQACCCRQCGNTHWQRKQFFAQRGVANTKPVASDLTPEQITARLDSLARRRRETRTWLRIQDAWQQRPGSEFHNVAMGEPL